MKAMRVRPAATEARGGGPATRKRRGKAGVERKDVILRLALKDAQDLKVLAAMERKTVQDFCLDVLLPAIERARRRHNYE